METLEMWIWKMKPRVWLASDPCCSAWGCQNWGLRRFCFNVAIASEYLVVVCVTCCTALGLEELRLSTSESTSEKVNKALYKFSNVPVWLLHIICKGLTQQWDDIWWKSNTTMVTHVQQVQDTMMSTNIFLFSVNNMVRKQNLKRNSSLCMHPTINDFFNKYLGRHLSVIRTNA